MSRPKEGIELSVAAAMKDIANRFVQTFRKFPKPAVLASGVELSDGFTPQEQLIALLNLEKWLKEQTSLYLDASVRSSSKRPRIAEEGEEKEESGISTELMTLQDEYIKLVGQRNKDAAILARLRENPVLHSVLFDENEAAQEPEQRRLVQKIRRRDEKVTELLRLADDLRATRAKRINTEAHARTRKIEARHAFEVLQKSIDEHRSTEKERADESGEYAIAVKKNAILRRVIQCLVIESHVNWAEDDDLRELMLRMETEL